MVRARRVRAVVACTQNDECCSPNPKRKDQGKILHNVNQSITQFFTTVKPSEHLPENILSEGNDLDDDEKEKFKEIPDVVLEDFKDNLPSTPHRIELHYDKDEVAKELKLKNFNHEKQQQLRDESKSLFKELQLPLLSDDIEIIDEKPQIITEQTEEVRKELCSLNENVNQNLNHQSENVTATNNNTTVTKARRRLNNNQSANQQAQPLKTKSVAKNNAENKSNNHKLTDFFPVRRSERKTKKTVLEEKQKTLEDNLRSGIEKGLRVYHFEGKGRGIVAMRMFNRGDFVVEYSGDLIDMQEARGRELKYAQDQNTGCYMYYFKHRNIQYCIDATAETGRLGRLVNHSRNGNLITRVIDVDQVPRLVLVAKDTIEIGEEVTYDYGDRSKESLRHHPWLAY